VHPMPPSDGDFGDDVDAAAAGYAAQLAAAVGASSSPVPGVPAFDVLMLGVGPDGHVASLFPGHPALDTRDAIAVGVRNSPKPPPERVSLTFEALNHARSVWFLVCGDAKADAVARARGGADVHEVPAAGVSGEDETIWFLDRASASRL
jgi:6-phosphogluconolactonase